MNNFGEKANFIFGIADLIRDTFNRGKYRDVILPFTVLRRIDYVLEPTKKQVLEEYEQFKTFPEDALSEMLRETSGYAFYNTSKFTFESLLEEPDSLAANLQAYINGFSAIATSLTNNSKRISSSLNRYSVLSPLPKRVQNSKKPSKTANR